MATAKEKGDRFYELGVALKQDATKFFTKASLGSMEEALGSLCSIISGGLGKSEENETVQVNRSSLQYMALLASGPLATMIAHKYRSKRREND